jgi:hypothetical protein
MWRHATPSYPNLGCSASFKQNTCLVSGQARQANQLFLVPDSLPRKVAMEPQTGHGGRLMPVSPLLPLLPAPVCRSD